MLKFLLNQVRARYLVLNSLILSLVVTVGLSVKRRTLQILVHGSNTSANTSARSLLRIHCASLFLGDSVIFRVLLQELLSNF